MGGTILVVDDVAMFLEIQKGFLRQSAAKVVTASDGVQALEMVRDHQPDLVFMDLHMPKLDGAACCTRLKSDPDHARLPVVLITSAGKDEDRSICIKAGCDDFLTKPLDRDSYLAKARKFVPSINRREKRMDVDIPVKFKMFGVTLSGRIRDISIRGVYIAADYPVEPGGMVELSFNLPDDAATAVRVLGRIRWVNTSKERKKGGMLAGFGVEFASLPDDIQKILRRQVIGEP